RVVGAPHGAASREDPPHAEHQSTVPYPAACAGNRGGSPDPLRHPSTLPPPPVLSARGAVRQRLLAGLLQAGFVGEVPAADRACAWRTDETGRGIALRLTTQGLAAIGRTPAVTRRKTRALPVCSLPWSDK